MLVCVRLCICCFDVCFGVSVIFRIGSVLVVFSKIFMFWLFIGCIKDLWCVFLWFGVIWGFLRCKLSMFGICVVIVFLMVVIVCDVVFGLLVINVGRNDVVFKVVCVWDIVERVFNVGVLLNKMLLFLLIWRFMKFGVKKLLFNVMDVVFVGILVLLMRYFILFFFIRRVFFFWRVFC